MLDLKIIIGSTRPGRAADLVTPWITQTAREHGAFDVEVLDLRDWQLPVFGETFATVGDPAKHGFRDLRPAEWTPGMRAIREKGAQHGACMRCSSSSTAPGGCTWPGSPLTRRGSGRPSRPGIC